MKKGFAIFFVFILCSAFALLDGNWQSLSSTGISFVIDGPLGKDVKGTVAGLTTDLEFYPDDVTRSHIKASVEAGTVNTRNKKRDAHLRTADFFDVEKFPMIHFASKSFRKVGEYFVVEGDLTLKDVTRPITIPFEFITSHDTAWFRGDFDINRLDYHVGNKSMLVGNKVQIHLDIPVLKR